MREQGTFNFNGANGSYYKSISARNIPQSSGLVVKTNFTWGSFGVYSTETTETFAITHKVVITQYTMTYSQGIVNIIATAKCTYQDAVVVNDPGTIAQYSIRDAETKEEVLSGDLTYQGSSWAAAVDMAGKSGEYYAVLRFKTAEVSTFFSTPDEADPTHGNQWEVSFDIGQYLIYIILGSVAAVLLVVIIVVVTTKKKENVIDRHAPDKKKKDKPLEIVEISKGELKKQKLGTGANKKTPVKKLDDKGLIFNVPTWEVEEEEEPTAPVMAPPSAATAAARTSSTAPASASAPVKKAPVQKTGYTLHCPGCNSWYEVDEYEKLGCPKCNTDLEVAMWCRQCSKWFDVPEPMDVDCPICAQKLSYSK